MTPDEKPGATSPGDNLLSETLASGRTPDDRRAEEAALAAADGGLFAGLTVGRFFLLNRLGAGGMGVVWAAYDPQLDRRVALKFVRADSAGAARANVLERFAREAQAMARVNHPNVIAVHDVGTSGEQVYIAEEFVRGMELSTWLAAQPRSQQEIVGVFLQAARGLSAAHAAGIIHRDFKPANVLVGDDGRVRVVDFGLARSIADSPEEPPPVAQSPNPGPLSSPLTRPGASLGTPFYMSPEQYQGTSSDARGDQFSFCVSLYEALYGERPFSAKTYYELAIKVGRGQIEAMPKGNKVPAWLREVLLKGLRTKKEDRFASMQEVITALEKDPGAGRRNRFAIGGAILIGASLLALGVYQVRQRKQLCHGGDSALAAVWNPRLQAVAKAAFLTTHLPFAEHVWSSVERTLSNYGRDWAAMHTDACEATRLRGEQSEEVLDLRMLCLSQHLQELKASADLFANADKQVVEKAVQVASGLSPVAECADVETLKAPIHPPKDAETRARVEEVRGTLAKGKTLGESARYAEGSVLAEGALASANAIAYKPLKAEALVLLGQLQARLRKDALAEATLEDAFYTAESCRHDAAASRAALQLIAHIGSDEARPAEGFQWARLEDALLERSNGSQRDQAELHLARGDLLDNAARYDEALAEVHTAVSIMKQVGGPDDLRLARMRTSGGLVLWHQGKYPEALAELSRALAIQEKALGPDHPDVADVHNDIGLLLSEEGKLDEALVEVRRALTIRENTFGPDHPEVGANHNGVGKVLGEMGRFPEALVEFRRALAIHQKSLAPDHPDVAQDHNNIGVMLWRQGHLDEALAEMRQGLTVSGMGPDHPALADGYNNIAAVLSDQGKNEEALVEFRHVVAIHEKALGPDHPRVASDLSNVGSILTLLNRLDEAMVEFRRALAIQDKQLGPDHPITAVTEGNIGEVELKRRDYKAAIGHLGHAVSVIEAKAPNPMTLGEFHFELAKARWAGNQDRAKAVSLAQQAREDYASLAARTKEVGEIDGWMKGHRLSQ